MPKKGNNKFIQIKTHKSTSKIIIRTISTSKIMITLYITIMVKTSRYMTAQTIIICSSIMRSQTMMAQMRLGSIIINQSFIMSNNVFLMALKIFVQTMSIAYKLQIFKVAKIKLLLYLNSQRKKVTHTCTKLSSNNNNYSNRSQKVLQIQIKVIIIVVVEIGFIIIPIIPIINSSISINLKI